MAVSEQCQCLISVHVGVGEVDLDQMKLFFVTPE